MGDESLDQRPVCHCTVICELPFVHVWTPAYPMILSYDPDPAPSMWPPALSSLFLLSLLPSTSFLLHLSLSLFYPFCLLYPITPYSSSRSFHSSFLYLSLVSPSQSTARGWASATSMKTDDSVLFFAAPLPQTPLQERSVCLGGEGEMRSID